MENITEQGNLGAVPKKTKKIDLAIDILEHKIRQTQNEVDAASKKLTTLQELYRELEKVKSDKYSE